MKYEICSDCGRKLKATAGDIYENGKTFICHDCAKRFTFAYCMDCNGLFNISKGVQTEEDGFYCKECHKQYE